MTIKFYQVDAFTDKLFGGNPAGVCILDSWLPNHLLQAIALENNLSETAFFIKAGNSYYIRWFTPATEVKLCGHATLASAYIIFNFIDKNVNEIIFQSLSGELIVTRNRDLLTLNFPAIIPQLTTSANELINTALQIQAKVIYKAEDYMVVLENEEQIRALNPDLNLINKLDSRGIVITAPGDKVDFVSRWFGPQVGLTEDPVTGSAHCMLAPYWAKEFNKKILIAEQLSKRLGKIICEISNDRVLLTGQAVLYMQGELALS